jgi:hypothetical protein
VCLVKEKMASSSVIQTLNKTQESSSPAGRGFYGICVLCAEGEFKELFLLIQQHSGVSANLLWNPSEWRTEDRVFLVSKMNQTQHHGISGTSCSFSGQQRSRPVCGSFCA